MAQVVAAEILFRLGGRARARRAELGLSQEQVAERAGLHRNYVGEIEQGRRNVAAVNLVKLGSLSNSTQANSSPGSTDRPRDLGVP